MVSGVCEYGYRRRGKIRGSAGRGYREEKKRRRGIGIMKGIMKCNQTRQRYKEMQRKGTTAWHHVEVSPLTNIINVLKYG